MPAPLTRRCAWILLAALAVAPAARAQAGGGTPLRKTDLVRLLGGATLAPGELPALVRRSCLSFTPTGRDWADFIALGADSAVLREIDGCARRAATPPTALPPRPVISPARTGFVSGAGQQGVVSRRPSQPVLFQVRDTADRPVAGQSVSLSVANGRLLGFADAVTDSAGRVEALVLLGEKAGVTVVSAAVGAIVRQATIYTAPGPPVKLVFRCGSEPVSGRVALGTAGPVVLHVAAQDAYGNEAPLTNLQATVGDEHVLRVLRVTRDTGGPGGEVLLKPGERGATTLAIAVAGQRNELIAWVATPPASGAARCP